ncbi:hypothetical protein COLU111180_05150 [Cohnella lubricantis]|uniref:Uncharacterized protein n=1 Tax=Cohnella lubricantis TaxID=2163172 RepID=A0A841TDF8_9BACL|nr:hypothetical protein [Cohnella lubricantis]MBB6677270.1 hypothetical protein [Cohnella lubricantis]MBP2116918.1 hypothetical protein [Cohnella lubricantis]
MSITNEMTYLVVWLIGLFGLVGFVMAAVAQMVRKDTMEHDKRFVWRAKANESKEDDKP